MRDRRILPTEPVVPAPRSRAGVVAAVAAGSGVALFGGCGTSSGPVGGQPSSSVSGSTGGAVSAASTGATQTSSSEGTTTTSRVITTTAADGGVTTVATSSGAPGLPVLVTSANNALWKSGTISTATGAAATITVDDTKTFQTFQGFGGAFNEKGWSNLSQLSAADQAQAMKLLFDANDGAAFRYGRIPIGANDYAVVPYSEDDTANDTSLTSFSITEDQKYIIPYVNAALAVNPNIYLWASPWSPPGWMKTGAATTSGTLGLNGGVMKNDKTTFTAYANYFVKWVQAYAAQKITIAAVGAQNEPNYPEAYPSCTWKAADYDTFVGQYLGPALKSAGLGTSIVLGTMSRNDTDPNTNESDQNVVTTVLGDSTTMGFIQNFGLQWNMMQKGAFIPAGVSPSSLPKWQTEHKCGNYSWGGAAYGQTYNASQAPNDFGYGEESWGNIHDWLTAGVSVYNAWNMILDPKGLSVANWPQDALIVADPSTMTLNPTPAYYAFRHFSQYTQPGATRVGTTGDVSCSGDGIGKCGTGVAAIAFKNPDDTHVVVLFNNQTSSAQVVLAVGGGMLQFTMPASSFATVVD